MPMHTGHVKVLGGSPNFVEQPQNMDARLLLAYVNLQQGNLDQAEMHVQVAVAKNPANAQAQKLLSPAEMGELFKVIALGKGVDTPLLGFARGDKSHML